MVRGESGRIVLEIDPSQKEKLYSALKKEGLTLKDWFLRQAGLYVRDQVRIPVTGVSAVSEDQTLYRSKPQQSAVSPSNAKGSRAKAKP